MNNKVYAFFGEDSNARMLNSIEVLGVRVNEHGSIYWVSKAGWKTLRLGHLTSRNEPLIAPLKEGRIVVYGGRDSDQFTLYDGIIIDAKNNTVLCYFQNPEMPLYSLCSG